MRHHLLAVWNPRLTGDAMEAHLRVLYQAAREYRSGRVKHDDVYVWWGKVRSENRLAPLPHFDQILEIETELSRDDEAEETHVFLTDYQSLYVAHLGEVTTDDPRKEREERKRIPSYYTKQKLECDFWFRLWDIRRLVSNDMSTVANELRKLRNVRHFDRPVSMYGGMLDLPLIVTESDGERYFEEEFRDRYTAGKFWIEADTERVGVGAIERDLRENLFGDRAWVTFGPSVRTFLSTAEKMWRDHDGDLMFDFSAVLIEYCKALEVRCNYILKHALAGTPERLCCQNRDGKSINVSQGRQLNLNELSVFIGGDQERVGLLKQKLKEGDWFTSQLPPILKTLAGIRGAAAHEQDIDRDTVRAHRAQLCGIGQPGVFPQLARVELR